MQERAAHRVAAHSGSGLALAVLPPRQCGGAVGRTMPRRHTRHHQHQPVVKLHAVARGPHETDVAMKYWSTTHDCTSATLAGSPLHRAPLLMFTFRRPPVRVNAHLDVSLVRWVLGVLSPSRGEGVQPALWHQVSPGGVLRDGVSTIPARCKGMLHQELLHTSLCVASVAQCYQHSKYSKKVTSRAAARAFRASFAESTRKS